MYCPEEMCVATDDVPDLVWVSRHGPETNSEHGSCERCTDNVTYGCLNQDDCEEMGHHWTHDCDHDCCAKCDEDHKHACEDEDSCTAMGGHWCKALDETMFCHDGECPCYKRKISFNSMKMLKERRMAPRLECHSH